MLPKHFLPINKPLEMEDSTFLLESKPFNKEEVIDSTEDCSYCKGKTKIYNKYDRNYEECINCSGTGNKYFLYKDKYILTKYKNNIHLLETFKLNTRVIHKSGINCLVHIGRDGKIYPFNSLGDFNIRNYRRENP